MTGQPSPNIRNVVLVLSESGTGGMQAMVGLLATGLHDIGVNVHIAAGGDRAMPAVVEESVASGATTFHQLPSPQGRGLLAWTVALRSLVRKVDPSIVHGHGLRTAWPLALTAGRHRSLVTCHGLPPTDLKRSAALVDRSRVAVAAVGPGLVAALAHAGLPAWLIENGVTPAPKAMSRTEIAATFNIPTAAPLVVQAARLSPQKDPLTAVAAVAQVEGAELLLLGGGPLASDVRALARDLGVSERIHLSDWHPAARSILGAADVALLSSRWEGQPLVLLEAAAAGVPIVATACPGIGDWLVDGREALLSPVGDAAELATHLRRAIGSEVLRRSLVTAGTSLAAQHSIDAMVANHLSLYDRLLAR